MEEDSGQAGPLDKKPFQWNHATPYRSDTRPSRCVWLKKWRRCLYYRPLICSLLVKGVMRRLKTFFPCDWPLRYSVTPSRDSLSSRVVKLELSSSLEGGLHASVFPQLLDDLAQLGRHCAFLNGVRQVLQLLSILLWCHQHTAVSRWLILTLIAVWSCAVKAPASCETCEVVAPKSMVSISIPLMRARADCRMLP